MDRIEGTATAKNLYAGTATSGSTGADILTISTAVTKKLHALLINMTNCTTGATVSVRAYTKVLNGGSMEKFYDQDYVKGTDPDVIWVVTGTVGIANDVRVETQSDNASDTSEDVTYSYITENDDIATSANVAAVPSDVWDEILTGATHGIPTSAGRRVREIGAFAIESGTAQAGNGHTITLAASASADDGLYNRNLIVLVDNTGAGQTRTIVDYDGSSKVVVVDRDWRVSPDATTEYQIVPDDTPLTVDHGVARGGTTRTITIRAHAASVDDAYLCNIVTIIAGKGRGQARLVGAYDGTTKVVTICGDDWVDTPDTTSVYAMMPYGTSCVSCLGVDALTQIDDKIATGKHDQHIKAILFSELV